jgi:hypothetical protein
MIGALQGLDRIGAAPEALQKTRALVNVSRTAERYPPAKIADLVATYAAQMRVVNVNVEKLPMSEIVIHKDGDGALRDVFRKVGITGPPRDGSGRIDSRVVHVGNDAEVHLTGLAHGMSSGLPSVAMAFELPDKRLAFVEFSLRSFLDAADMLKQLHGDPRKFPGEMFLNEKNDFLPQIVRHGSDVEFTPLDDAASASAKIAGLEMRKVMNALASAEEPNVVRAHAGGAAKAFRKLRDQPECTPAERVELDKLVAQMEALPADHVVRFEGTGSVGTVVDSVVAKIMSRSEGT